MRIRDVSEVNFVFMDLSLSQVIVGLMNFVLQVFAVPSVSKSAKDMSSFLRKIARGIKAARPVQKHLGLNLKIPPRGIRRFTDLRAADESGVPTLLNRYATDPAEFFALSVEAFFDRPRALLARHPQLYAELQKYFQQDPLEFSAER